MLLLDLTVPELVAWECGKKLKEMLSFQLWPGSWPVVMQEKTKRHSLAAFSYGVYQFD